MRNTSTNGQPSLSPHLPSHSVFFSRRWDAASHELQSHVISSRAQRSPATRKFFRERDRRDEAEEASASVSAKKSSRRTYGFDSSKVSRYDDGRSENLYRYKNMSSSFMRERSPPREAETRPPRPPIEEKPKKKESDDDDEDDADVVVPKEPTETTPSRRRTTRK